MALFLFSWFSKLFLGENVGANEAYYWFVTCGDGLVNLISDLTKGNSLQQWCQSWERAAFKGNTGFSVKGYVCLFLFFVWRLTLYCRVSPICTIGIFGLDNSFFFFLIIRASLCIVGYLAAFLVSILEIPIPSPCFTCDDPECFQILSNVPWGPNVPSSLFLNREGGQGNSEITNQGQNLTKHKYFYRKVLMHKKK